MLSLLKIQNLALVDELLWMPQSGFMGITGETGAGKSVVMGAISLILGERADKGMIRSGETQCCLEALFSLSQYERINELLAEAGVPLCEEGELLIRRQITGSSNKQFINHSPVTLQLLRQVGAGLVDMHHPDANRSLLSQQRQLELLDAFAENGCQRREYMQAYQAYSDARQAYEELLKSERASVREIDYLEHQIQEIEEAGFTADEVAELESRWQRARNAERLRSIAIPMAESLDGDEYAVLARLRHSVRLGHELERLDTPTSNWLAPLTNIVEELEEFYGELSHYLDGMDADPMAMENLAQRVSLFDTLKRKYGADFEAIEAHLIQCQEELRRLSERDECLLELEAAQQQAYELVLKQGQALRESRRAAIPALEGEFLNHVRQLGFLQSLFEVALCPTEAPTATGLEELDFLFGPNPGEPLKPLRMIASSGELARIMLALKGALARQDDTPLLVFDEIDANVGGEVARSVGMKMRELGEHHQVIAITHFPQVAALADYHYLISKHVHEGRSVSRLQEVQGESRIKELMRMLGMDGDSARAHAKELLASTEI